MSMLSCCNALAGFVQPCNSEASLKSQFGPSSAAEVITLIAKTPISRSLQIPWWVTFVWLLFTKLRTAPAHLWALMYIYMVPALQSLSLTFLTVWEYASWSINGVRLCFLVQKWCQVFLFAKQQHIFRVSSPPYIYSIWQKEIRSGPLSSCFMIMWKSNSFVFCVDLCSWNKVPTSMDQTRKTVQLCAESPISDINP